MDRLIPKKKWPPKKIVGFSFAGLLLVVVVYSVLLGTSPSTLNVQIEKLTIAAVTKGPFQEFLPVQGTVLPLTTIYLDAIEGGRVEKLFVEEGSLVKQGDSLLQLSNTNLQLDVMYREAQLFEQINNLRSTRLAMEEHRLTLRAQLVDLDYQIQRQQRLYERSQALLKQALISHQEYEQVKDEYEYVLNRKAVTLDTQHQDSLFRRVQIEQLEASVKRMQANLDVVKQNLENLTLTAPLTGQLTALHAEIGESKAPGQRLGQIDVLAGFKVRAGIDEHYIARITGGQPGDFDFAGATYKLVMKKVYPEVRDGKFETDLEFEGVAPQGLRRGQTVQIRLALGGLEEAMLIPRGGFYQKTGGQWVYVVDSSGATATKRPIKLGRQNPQVFEVLNGLEPGERVITSSYDNFGEMDKLVLKKSGAPP